MWINENHNFTLKHNFLLPKTFKSEWKEAKFTWHFVDLPGVPRIIWISPYDNSDRLKDELTDWNSLSRRSLFCCNWQASLWWRLELTTSGTSSRPRNWPHLGTWSDGRPCNTVEMSWKILKNWKFFEFESYFDNIIRKKWLHYLMSWKILKNKKSFSWINYIGPIWILFSFRDC